VTGWTLSLSWLTLKPSWRVRDHSFEARAHWLSRALTLFAYDRHLRIDTNRRAVFLRVRRFWFSRTGTVIPFARIKCIAYGYAGMSTGARQTAPAKEAMDFMDKFRVGLLLADDPDPITLFSFRADAGWLARLAAEWLDDKVAGLSPDDITGDEEEASREFVGLLRKHLGVPARSLMQSRVQEALQSQLYDCPNCQRQIMRSAPKCVYCSVKFVQTGQHRGRVSS
jgi:hypothetical protein